MTDIPNSNVLGLLRFLLTIWVLSIMALQTLIKEINTLENRTATHFGINFLGYRESDFYGRYCKQLAKVRREEVARKAKLNLLLSDK